MVTYRTADKTVKLPFPEDAFKNFKEQANVAEDEKLTEEQIKRIYVLCVDAFLSGDLSTDDIAAISTKLIDSVKALEDRKDPDLSDAMYAGSEIGFYIRNKNLLIQFNGFLKEVLNYADDYRVELNFGGSDRT